MIRLFEIPLIVDMLADKHKREIKDKDIKLIKNTKLNICKV